MQIPGAQAPRVAIAVPGVTVALLLAGFTPPAPTTEPAGAQKKPGAKKKPADCRPGQAGERCRQARERERRHRKARRRANRKQKRPNVIVITTDDQNQSDMVAMGVTLDQLGDHGTTFASSYASNPLCCPSRATFLTGQYAHNHGVVSTELPNGYAALNHANTLPVWLKSAKYRTAMIGKYLNGYGLVNPRERPPGWSKWYALTGGTDQKRYKFRLNENGKIVRYKRKKRDYVSDVLGRQVYELLREWAPHPKPFFLWFNPTAPHGQNGVPFDSTRDPEPAPRYLGRYDLAQAPRTPNFDEADVSDKPEFIRNEPPLGTARIADIDRRQRGRLESLLSVDEQVGRIVRLLAKSKDLGKTYIIFTSDNGLQLGAHRLIFKAYLYEESTRVPLIIRGPGFPEGAVREQLVSNIDLAPTIVEITRVQPRLTMDGISLLPLANNIGAGLGRDLLFESQIGGAYGIRSGKWIFNEYGNGETELYDLERDPFELESQHANPNLLSLKTMLDARLNQLRFCAGATCR
ncbi:MAG: sulfatase family protein [Solirubrobacterales bacterium]